MSVNREAITCEHKPCTCLLIDVLPGQKQVPAGDKRLCQSWQNLVMTLLHAAGVFHDCQARHISGLHRDLRRPISPANKGLPHPCTPPAQPQHHPSSTLATPQHTPSTTPANPPAHLKLLLAHHMLENCFLLGESMCRSFGPLN